MNGKTGESMDKYVSCESLKKAVAGHQLLATSGYDIEEAFISLLDKAPEAIIRCQGCRYFDLKGSGSWGMCKLFGIDKEAIGHCDEGVRK